ncbi:hypothetical protein J2127_001044 [Methanococcus voltae]|uniref:hypothetical protein n=1 Tax=Methanococcus voltae TaxID=2188 RepID=UPI001AE428CA|nr:hypothetical protein [Methanococcus voltae]MBP2143875.1 hypothetical protein [Methanococcus voltae]
MKNLRKLENDKFTDDDILELVDFEEVEESKKNNLNVKINNGVIANKIENLTFKK